MTNPVLQRSIQRIIQTLIILLTLYYTMLGGFFVGVHESRWRIVTYVLSGLILSGWLINKLRRKQSWPHTPLDWALLAVIGTMFLSTFTSTDPRLSLDSLLLTLTYGLCFYFAVDLTKSRILTEKIINAMLLTAAVICAVGLFEYWQWYYGDWLGEVNRSEAGIPWRLSDSLRIRSVLYNPNILAYYLLPILGISLYKLNSTYARLVRLGWGVWILLVLSMIFLTQSRGGLLGATAVLIIFGGLRLNMTKTPNSSRARFRPSWRLTLGLAITLGLSALLLLWPFIFRTFQRTLFLGQRDDIWRIALAIIRTFPWLGSGPGTFGQQYFIFRDVNSDFIHSHAHNLWLTFTAEDGFIGLAAILWLNLAFLRVIPKLLQGPTEKLQRALSVAVLAALGGMSVHNLFDDFLDYPMLSLFLIFLIALSLNLSNGNTQDTPGTLGWTKTLQTALAIILLLIIGGVALWFLPAFIAYDSARIAAAQGDWSQATQDLERAVAIDPGYRFYQQQLVLAYGKLVPEDVSLLPQAISRQTFLLQQSNHYPPDYANLACLYRQADDLPAAIQAMTRAVEMEPEQIRGANLRVSRMAYQFSLVQFYEQIDQVDSAQRLLVQILEAYPWVAASPFWLERSYQLQSLVSHVENSVDDASLEELANLADLYYYAGHYQKSLTIARQLLINDSKNVSNLTRLGRVLAQLGDVETALTVLNQALVIDPYNPNVRLIRAQVFMQQGRFKEAEIDLRVVIAIGSVPEAYTIWGQLAERQNLLAEAKRYYERAILDATALQTNYAHLIGRREPLPEEILDCVIIPYTKEQLSEPSLALGRLLEIEGNQAEAVKVYEFLLRHEPYNRAARECLNRLRSQS
jgi:putative inorganic carbon (HCO3(-)) transporter